MADTEAVLVAALDSCRRCCPGVCGTDDALDEGRDPGRREEEPATADGLAGEAERATALGLRGVGCGWVEGGREVEEVEVEVRAGPAVLGRVVEVREEVVEEGRVCGREGVGDYKDEKFSSG